MNTFLQMVEKEAKIKMVRHRAMSVFLTHLQSLRDLQNLQLVWKICIVDSILAIAFSLLKRYVSVEVEREKEEHDKDFENKRKEHYHVNSLKEALRKQYEGEEDSDDEDE